MLATFVLVALFGLAQSLTTDTPSVQEWDCTRDHRLHETDPRRFLQSPGGFAEGIPVFEAICPSQLQVFSLELCQCVYNEQVQQLLSQSCNVRVPPGVSEDVYEQFDPSIPRDTVEELYIRKSCFSLLPEFIAQVYRAAGVIPLFFNQTGCRCDWVPGVDRSIEANAVPPAGSSCERIVDQNFTNPRVSSDEVGNWFDVFPNVFQNNMTLRRGGAAFGEGVRANAVWRLAGFDFTDLNLVARFDSDSTSGNQLIFTNLCQESPNMDGIVELLYNPGSRVYTLRFFSDSPVTCTARVGAGTQTIQLIYRDGSVSLLVNGIDCDISARNPVTNDDERLQLNQFCPVMLGGSVYTNPGELNFGDAIPGVPGLQGVFYRFMALRDCGDPPQMVLDRIAGLVS